MKANTIIYWITTAIISLMMLSVAYQYMTNPKMAETFAHLGFPSYFRIELACAKVIGALVLIIPGIPPRIKNWAYAGFGITFISAAIAHFNSGDPTKMIMTPLIVFAILIISYVCGYKLNKV